MSIGRNGVGIRITGTTVRYGAAEPAIKALAIGEKVRVSYDSEDLRKVQVWSMDYEWICEAGCNRKFNRAVPSEALREAMRQRNREKRTLREARKVGLNHLRDPMQRAIASLEHDSAKQRLPDPPDGGGPVLKPVPSPLMVPPVRQPMRKAVGAEDLDVFDRFDAFANKPAGRPARPESFWKALNRFNSRESGQ